MTCSVRNAKAADAQAILDIYRPVVEQTAISFETEVPSPNEMKNRINTILKTHAYLIADNGTEIAGYAYGSPFRPRNAYKHSVEVTVYVAEQHHNKGIATKLYLMLFDILKSKGFHTVLAGIALPNDASVALHRSLNFNRVGTFKEVGFKFGKWHDVEWWQRGLNGE